MDPANVDIPEEPAIPEEHASTTSSGLLSCLNYCLSSVAIFFFGMMLAVPGGLLLARTAAVVLRSLEILAEDKQLMDNLENYVNTTEEYDLYISDQINLAHRKHNVHMFNVFISVLAFEFGVLTGIFSLGGGLPVGLSMYKLVIQKSRETAEGKALSVAGPLCLMVISTVGALLGLLLHMYLSITFTAIFCFHFILVLLLLCFIFFSHCGRCSLLISVLTVFALSPLNTPVAVCIMLLMTFFFQSKLNLLTALIPKLLPMTPFFKSSGFILNATPITMYLFITDVFNFARQPIVTLQQTNITSTTSAVVEGIFVGVLSSHFMIIALGMSLFLFRGDFRKSGRICVGAVTFGGAVIAVLESVVDVLGPGPTIGALMGVAGAVGVTLSAAGAKVFHYGQEKAGYGLVGLFGVTVGAVVGAYLMSFKHSGLSPLFMCLCAATIPGTLILNWMENVLKTHNRWSVISMCLTILTVVLSAVWVYFAIPIQGVITFVAYFIVFAAITSLLSCISCAFDFWGLTFSQNMENDESDPSSPEAQGGNQIDQLMDLFSWSYSAASNITILENVYNEAASKLVPFTKFTKGLRQRVQFSESN